MPLALAGAEELPYSGQTDLATGGAVSAVRLADLDGDGSLDAIHGNPGIGAPRLRWQANTGTGSFGSTQTLANNAPGAAGIAVGDLDGNGAADVASLGASGLEVIRNPSDGVLVDVVDGAVAGDGLAIADLDGDGILDLVTALSGGTFSWYEGDGTPFDGGYTKRDLDSGFTEPYAVAVADVDGDGDLDVVGADRAGNTLHWFENDGTPLDGGWTNHTLANTETAPESVAASDVDLDGDVDVVACASTAGTVAWWANDGTPGGLGDWARTGIDSEVTEFVSVEPRDIDGDGDVDVLVGAADGTANDNDKVTWYENTDRVGGVWVERVVEETVDGGLQAIAGDIDGDGDVDLLTGAAGDGVVTWYRNDSTGRDARFPQAQSLGYYMDEPTFLVTGDFDGDGDLDIASRADGTFGPDPNERFLWQENLDGIGSTWSAPKPIVEVGNQILGGAGGDLDGDGDIDFALGGRDPDNTYVWYENASGDGSTWTRRVIVADDGIAVGVAVGDLDADGHLDIVAANLDNDEIVWLENDGGAPPTFTEHSVGTGIDSARRVEVADLNDDGHLDVIVTDNVSDTVDWFESDGSTPPGFTKRAVATGVTGARGPAIADLDGDGDLDLAAIARTTGEVFWYANQGGTPITWSPTSITTVCEDGPFVRAADLDVDGDMDLVCPDRTDVTMMWLENDGSASPSFTERTMVLDAGPAEGSFTRPHSLALPDIDGDGDPDVVVGWHLWIAIHRNGGGQAELTTIPSTATHAFDGATVELLELEARHAGRAEDADLEIASLQLLFEEGDGDPLTSGEANALLSDLDVYLDDGDGVFDGGDSVVLTAAPLTLTGGVATLVIADGDPDFQLAPGGSETYFVVATFAGSASSQTPRTLRLTHLATAAGVENADADLPVSKGGTADARTATLTLLATSADEDSDGLTNQAEVDIHGTDPFVDDSDGDGILDGVEIGGSTLALDSDTDDDGVPDGAELALGSDPTLAGSTPTQVTNTPYVDRGTQATGFYTSRSALGDVDGDGDLDLLVYLAGGSVVLYHNDGGPLTGWVATPVEDPPFYTASDLYLEDIDGDGDLDVVRGDWNGQRIDWFRNELGDGTSWSSLIPVDADAGLLFRTAVADVDGDGDLDVVGTRYYANDVVWFENEAGDGTDWDVHSIRSGLEAPREIAVGDLDGDGDLDVAYSLSHRNELAFAENLGGGAAWLHHPIPAFGLSAATLAAADVDRDGDLDLLLASVATLSEQSGVDETAWLENLDGDGSAWARRVIAPSYWLAAYAPPADLDGDGDLDLPAGDSGSPATFWVENVGGDGSAWLRRDLPNAGATLSLVSAGDLDGDGDVDLASVNLSANSIGWWENERIHRSSLFNDASSLATGDGPEAVEAGDLDGDGDLDLVSYAGGDGVLEWFENLAGDGSSWGSAQTIDAAAPGEGISAQPYGGLDAVDLDADGDLDLLATSKGDNRAVWHENRLGEGMGWSEHLITSAVDDPAVITAADFDGDGDLDPVVSSVSNTSAEVRWLANDGLSFGSSTTIVSGGQRRDDIAVADVDRDGHPDVIVANSFIDDISWYRNAGDGSSWTPNPIAAPDMNPQGLSVGDIDGDGDVDVAACVSPTSSWYENRESDSLPWLAHEVGELAGCAETRLADLDQDGDLDLQLTRLFIGTGGSGVVVYENDAADGSSWTPHDASPAQSAADTTLGDFDRDGDLDVAVVARGTDELLLYANGGGQFGLPTTDVAYQGMLDTQTRQVLELDLTHEGRTGDGDLELATLELLLADDVGTPLDSAEANALVATLRVRVDEGNGVYDGTETVVATVSSFALSAGVETIVLGDGDTNVQLTQASGSQRFFIDVEIAAAASSQTPSAFSITHLTESSSTAEDRDFDLPLGLAKQASVSTGTIQTLGGLGDSDGDGLSNLSEVQTHLTDPGDPDTDDDGLLDGDEVNTHSTNPLATDTDADGLDDGTEVALPSDPTNPDSDDGGNGDGYCDGPGDGGGACTAGDNCPFQANPTQTNSDGATAGDGCQCGDVAGADGIDGTDVQQARELLVGATTAGDPDFCDVDGDEVCSVADVFAIERLANGQSATVVDACPGYFAQ